jgi:predicted metal-dependent hydrolase
VQAAVEEAVSLFNSGEYFTFHEVLEDVWRRDDAPDRSGWKGVIQAGVGYLHHRRGNRYGAIQTWTRAVRYLRQVESPYRGIDVDDLLRQVEAALRATEESGPDQLAPVPKPALRRA